MAALFSFFKKKTTIPTSTTRQSQPAAGSNHSEAEKFVGRLEELGYFRYADPGDIQALNETMIKEYNPDSELSSIWDDHPTTPKDYRYYFCDNEDLYEEGGFTNMLKHLQPTFDKIGLQINVTNHHEVWDEANNWLDHSIAINGREYVIFRHFTEIGWSEAVQRLVEILNEELALQNKEERVYPVNGGNDGRIIFLSDDQFSYINAVYTNKNWKPLTLHDWIKVGGGVYMNVD